MYSAKGVEFEFFIKFFIKADARIINLDLIA